MSLDMMAGNPWIRLLAAATIIALSMVAAALVEPLCSKVLEHLRPDLKSGMRALLARLTRWSLVAAGGLLAISALGVDLGAAMTSGAVVFVGVGVAVQKIIQSFVAGTLLLAEQTLSPGDVLEIDGELVRVQRVGMRATTVLTRRNQKLTIPNFELATHVLRTLSPDAGGHWVEVEIVHAYQDEPEEVEMLLQEAALAFRPRIQELCPRVLMDRLGDHGIHWKVQVAISMPIAAPHLESELRKHLYSAMKRGNLTVPFHQLRLHQAQTNWREMCPDKSS